MFLNPGSDVLGLPVPAILFGIGIVLAVVGFAWVRRILGNPEDGDDHWRFRR